MMRFFSGIAILLLSVGSASGDDPAGETPEPSLQWQPPASALDLSDDPAGEAPEPPDLLLREDVWRAALLVLEGRGLAIRSASKEEGRITTEFASLDPEAVPKTTLLNDQDRGAPWARAEYRYHIKIGELPDQGERLLVAAEIRVWEQEDQAAAPRPEAKQVLQSNDALEGEFLEALMGAMGKLEGDE